MILNGFLRDKKEDFKQKVLWKNVRVVSLYTHFRGSIFFLFVMKKELRDEGFGFCYKAVPKSSITHYFLIKKCVFHNSIILNLIAQT